MYNYHNFTSLEDLLRKTKEYGELQTEYGNGEKVRHIVEGMEANLQSALAAIRDIVPDAGRASEEPDDYPSIRRLCTGGNIRVKNIPKLHDKMEGALLGRFIGCTLGVPVELWSVDRMETLAKYNGMAFPPTDYWTAVSEPWGIQYGTDPRSRFTRDGIDGVPVDDDITYTILGLLIVERYGFEFSTADVGEIWIKLLPMAYTAEEVALKNLNAGIPAHEAAMVDNPYCQWIGADIRADGFAFAAAGNPEHAASMGYRDAYLTHRRNGIYGEMFFAAAEAAAFTVTDPLEAIRIALREIPSGCALSEAVRWALETGPALKDYREARFAVDKRFPGMDPVHTINNACLTIFGLILGGGDFTKTVSNVVAMGLDNDCTAATAGSIIGAVAGAGGIPSFWTKGFNGKVRTYLRGLPEFRIEDIVNRFVKLASS